MKENIINFEITNEEKREYIVSKLEHYGMSRSFLAKKIGVDKSRISQALSKEKPHLNNTLYSAIFYFFESKAKLI